MNQSLSKSWCPPESTTPEKTGETSGPVVGWYSRFISSVQHLYPSTPEHDVTCTSGSFPTPPVIYERSEPIKTIVDRIESGSRTLVVVGVPGIGKTCVASAVLYEPKVIERFGVRRHWANLGGINSLEEYQNTIAQSLACKAPTVLKSNGNVHTSDHHHTSSFVSLVSSSAVALWKGSTSQDSHLPRLLVLDDFEGVWNSSWRTEAEDYLYELQHDPGLKILITMRGAIGLPRDWWRLEINPLSPHAAKLLFLTIHPKSDPQIDLLLQRIAYVPRTIVWTAQACQARGIEPSEILKEWNRKNTGFLQLKLGDPDSYNDPDDSIDSWVHNVSGQLPTEAKRLFGILSMLPSGMSYGDLLEINSQIRDTRETGHVLSDMSLVSIHNNAHISIPLSLRPYSLKYNQLERGTLEGLYSYFFTLAQDGLLKPGDQKFPQAIGRLVKQQLNLESILQHALEEGYFGAVEPALQYSAPHYAIQPRIDIVEKALEVSKRRTPNLLLAAQCLKRMGDLYIDAGSFGRGASTLQRAIHLFKKLGKEVAAAECEISVAKTIWINDRPQAIIHLERTLQEFVRLNDITGQAKCSHLLGEYYLSVGRKGDGRSAIESSLAKFKEISDMHSVAKCTLSLAQIYLAENRLDDARSALSALDSLREYGDRSAVAKGQRLLASLFLHERRLEDARSEMKKALKEYEWLGHHLDAAFCMWRLGEFSEDEEAIELYQKAIPIFQDCNFTFAMAECRLDLGLKLMEMKRFDEALLHLEISRPQLQANKTGWLANFCLAAVIICLRQDGQTDLAELEMKNNRAALLESARMKTSSPWKLFVLPADDPTDSGGSGDGEVLVMFFSRGLSPRTLIFLDPPPLKWRGH